MKASRPSVTRLALVLPAIIVLGLCSRIGLPAATNSFDEKTIKQWTHKGPLTDKPEQISEVLPLSDQRNAGGWVRDPRMWDEFDAPILDTNRWTVGMYWWQGRQPA